MDILTQKKRSEVMSRIKGKGNKATELAFIKMLRINGITGWRRHLDIVGKPDFVFMKKKIVVFVDGCFWHCCPLHFQYPKTNKMFWRKKLNSNKLHDREVNKKLKSDGWSVLRFWEHSIENNPQTVVNKLIKVISEEK